MKYKQFLQDSGAPSPNTTVEFNYAQVKDGTGYVVATRRMDLGAGEE